MWERNGRRRAAACAGRWSGRRQRAGLSRRGFLTVVGATSGTILATTIGEAVTPLSRLAVLAPRRAGLGPQGVPVNHVASAAVRAAARSPAYRLTVTGSVPRPGRYALADLRALPLVEARLPISCVEGWSTDGYLAGRAHARPAGSGRRRPGALVLVESLETHGSSHRSTLNSDHARDPLTLLAMELNGEPLDLDHGYPVRLIAPNRPGTEQTKWVTRLTVL